MAGRPDRVLTRRTGHPVGVTIIIIILFLRTSNAGDYIIILRVDGSARVTILLHCVTTISQTRVSFTIIIICGGEWTGPAEEKTTKKNIHSKINTVSTVLHTRYTRCIHHNIITISHIGERDGVGGGPGRLDDYLRVPDGPFFLLFFLVPLTPYPRVLSLPTTL